MDLSTLFEGLNFAKFGAFLMMAALACWIFGFALQGLFKIIQEFLVAILNEVRLKYAAGYINLIILMILAFVFALTCVPSLFATIRYNF